MVIVNSVQLQSKCMLHNCRLFQHYFLRYINFYFVSIHTGWLSLLSTEAQIFCWFLLWSFLLALFIMHHSYLTICCWWMRLHTWMEECLSENNFICCFLRPCAEKPVNIGWIFFIGFSLHILVISQAGSMFYCTSPPLKYLNLLLILKFGRKTQ